jgi:hypothetical protein
MTPSPFPAANLATLDIQYSQANGAGRPIDVGYEIHGADGGSRVGVEFTNDNS